MNLFVKAWFYRFNSSKKMKMKQKLFYIITLLLFSNFILAQVLYDEDFDLLMTGDVGQDFTGATPGQGGWYIETFIGTPQPAPTPLNFQIETESDRGKVLALTGNPVGNTGFLNLEQKGFEARWNTRDWGNNVLKFECDFFNGNSPNFSNGVESFGSVIALYGKKSKLLAGFGFWHKNGLFLAGINRGAMQNIVPLNANGTNLFIPKNRWYHLVIYVDYNNAQVHFEIPSLGISVTKIVFDLLPAPETMEDYPPSFISFHTKNNEIQQFTPTVKLDNVKISAIKYSPVSTVDILAFKFNLYPNPVDDVVTISNKENITIEEVVVYNMNGKVIKTQTFNYQNEVQLNMGQMSAGVYLLHIKTNQGETVKKVIKK